jgi:1,4-alpha-glucan branching enzyme
MSELFRHQWTLDSACSPTWLTRSRVHFRVWAPHGELVRVQLAPGQEIQLAKEPNNPHFWCGEADPVQPGQRYRIVLTSTWNDCHDREGHELKRRDPYAREADFESEWCLLTDPSFDWSPFEAPAHNELVLYELHVGSFCPPRDGISAFERTARRLEHVKELGFNAIQLMPVTEFGGIWGYNPRQLLTVHGPWGSAVELRRLIDRAHQLELAVVLDLVLNHGAAKGNCLWNWDGFGPDNCGGIYFEGERDTPWGRRFAFHKREVLDYLKAACRMWLEEYNVDGLRFDSVHNMPWHVLQEMTHDLRANYPGKMLIAEVTPEHPAVVTDAGFDACWIHAAHFDSVKVMRQRYGGHRHLATLKSMLDMHPGFPRSCSGINSALGSHDQVGDRRGGHEHNGIHRYFVARWGGRRNWHARAQTRMWYALQAMARGLPLCFMGTETLQDDWWHVDERHCFDWHLAAGDDEFATQMMRCVRDINMLRGACCAVTSENIRFVHEDANNTLLGWVRWADPKDPRRRADREEVVLCVANLSEEQWSDGSYALRTGWGAHRAWRLAFNSQAEAYGGWDGSGPENISQSDESGRLWLTIPKWSVLVFELA